MYVWYYRTYINNIHFTIVDLYLFLSHILGDPKQNRYIIYINTSIYILIFTIDEFKKI